MGLVIHDLGKNMITVITSENYKDHRIGAKAQRLFILKENGFNVPDFFCVNEVPEIEEISSLTEGWTTCSVRSAAFCEDSDGFSFAGQFDTFLNVCKEDITEKINECFLSAKKESVISYCRENGINADEIKMTGIVQKMVDADYSGVIFSSNPQGILNETVIVAGRGTGDNVVEEKTDVTTCYYNRNDRKYFTESCSDNAPGLESRKVEERGCYRHIRCRLLPDQRLSESRHPLPHVCRYAFGTQAGNATSIQRRI